MDTRPVAIMGGIDELRQRVLAGHHDYAIMLYLLDAIAAALWPNGDPDAERDADTTTAIGDLMTRAGYRPEPEV